MSAMALFSIQQTSDNSCSADVSSPNPRRPPHPLKLKAFDSQIHILFKSWVDCAGSLPMTPEVGAGELFKLMDARVAIFGVITYEYNRIIADFALQYGADHDLLIEASRKDIAAYDKCSEDNVPKLCSLWNAYSEAFRAKFKETFGFPKKGANLMKEELSRLLHISKAMERVWLDECRNKSCRSSEKSNEKNEGIRAWIANTTANSSNPDSVGEDAAMQCVLDENKRAAKQMAEELRERMERRKHYILHTNYVEELCNDEWCQAQHIGSEGNEVQLSDGIETLQSETSRNDSMWGDGAEERQGSEGDDSYNEFNIEDMRYLRPALFHRPPTPMALLQSPKPVILRPLTPVVSSPPSAELPVVHPASPGFLPPKFPQLHTTRSNLTLRSSSGTPSSSSQSSPLVSKESFQSKFRSSVRRVFSSEPHLKDQGLSLLVSSATNIASAPVHPVGANTPTKPGISKPLRKPKSMGNLRISPKSKHQPLLPIDTMPSRIPAPDNPRGSPSDKNEVKHLEDIAKERSGETGGHVEQPSMMSMSSTDSHMENSPLRSTSGNRLRGRRSTFFSGGRKVKEVPKGEEDAFLEEHACKGVPF